MKGEYIVKIGYVRVSTQEQNTIRQEVMLRELGVDEVFIDKASGKSTDRSELRRMMEYVRKGDTVIVESISRFARNTRDLLELVEQLRSMKLKEAAKKVEDGIEETLTYCDFPSEHWTRIRTNNVIERLNREIRRRTRVVGSFPDGNSALMLVCARLRHVAGTQWGNKKYMNMKHLEAALEDASIAG